MIEEWKDIPGYEGKYRVSNMGDIMSVHYKKAKKVSERKLKPRGKEYLYVVLSKNNNIKVVKLHRAVAEAFIPNTENKPYVNHKDGNKFNNCVDNLEWVTPLENNLHCYHVLGKHPMKGMKWDKNKNSRKVAQYYISEEGYEYHIATYANSVIAAKINGLSNGRILMCCRGHKEAKQSGGYIWRFA